MSGSGKLGPFAARLAGTFAGSGDRNSTDPPLRSCSQNEKPPALPSPGIEGGMKAKAIASGLRRQSAVQARDDSLAFEISDVRSSQGLRPMKKNPW